jgi:hypothetical protein
MVAILGWQLWQNTLVSAIFKNGLSLPKINSASLWLIFFLKPLDINFLIFTPFSYVLIFSPFGLKVKNAAKV